MIHEPFVNFFFVDIFMYRRIIQDNDDGLAIRVLCCQSINEFDNLRTLDRCLIHAVRERIGGIVERAKNVHMLARNARVGAMWHTQRRPGPLYVRHVRHSRFIEKKQVRHASLGSNFQLVENDCLLYKFGFGTFFFKDNRQRLKLMPCSFKRTANRSRLKSGDCG